MQVFVLHRIEARWRREIRSDNAETSTATLNIEALRPEGVRASKFHDPTVTPRAAIPLRGQAKASRRAVEISTTFGTDSSYDSFFVHRSKLKLGQKFYAEALSGADKVIELNPSSYFGYELKHAALREAQCYDCAFWTFKIILSKLDDVPDPRIR
ncbi:hypothetical protein F4604DRAFT_1898648 [Suillus subluteus]|nr:hypothetical protein F4604DRAFT_1898648 [Suillus subluteus]